MAAQVNLRSEESHGCMTKKCFCMPLRFCHFVEVQASILWQEVMDTDTERNSK